MLKASLGWSDKVLVCVAFALLFASLLKAAEPFQTFEGCHFVPSEWADGDSFLVRLPDGREEVIRLYYVDCIEDKASNALDARRIREQARYFGVDDYAATLSIGKEATAFTAKALSSPFTLHTAFANALGRSAKPRYYGFITTASGEDLAQKLVEEGLARIHGVKRKTPDGIPHSDRVEQLADLELAAAIRRKGIWAHSDPEKIISMREEERQELRGLEAINDALVIAPPTEPIDVNTASLEELISVGLRESIADLVIQSRPFKTLEDLGKVRGIGPVTLKKVEPYLRFPQAPLSDNVRMTKKSVP